MSKKSQVFKLFAEGKKPNSPEVKALGLTSKTGFNYFQEWKKTNLMVETKTKVISRRENMGMKKKVDMEEHQNIPDAEKKQGIAMALHDLFLDKGELCAAEARRFLKVLGRKMSYASVQRLFYDLRQIGLIEFTHSEPGKALIDKRYYRIIAGKENDPRWDTYPHYELYPWAKVGGLKYEIGSSEGRAKKYVKGD